MKRLAVSIAAALLAGIAVLFAAGSAQAYPDTTITITVGSNVVPAGGTVTFTVTSPVPCSWVASFNGERRTGSGTSFSSSFAAPKPVNTTVFYLTITCNTGSARVSGHAGNAIAVPRAIVTRRVPITVKGTSTGSNTSNGSGNGSGLPNTGGPDIGILGGAVALILAGAGTVAYNRRRSGSVA